MNQFPHVCLDIPPLAQMSPPTYATPNYCGTIPHMVRFNLIFVIFLGLNTKVVHVLSDSLKSIILSIFISESFATCKKNSPITLRHVYYLHIIIARQSSNTTKSVLYLIPILFSFNCFLFSHSFF